MLLLQRAYEGHDISGLTVGHGDGLHLTLTRGDDFLDIGIRLGLDFLRSKGMNGDVEHLGDGGLAFAVRAVAGLALGRNGSFSFWDARGRQCQGCEQ